MSRQEKQALNIQEETARLVDGHCQIAIPQKCHPPDLPINKPLAEHRLNLLRKKFLKDPKNSDLYSRDSAFITDLLGKGCAKKVPENLNLILISSTLFFNPDGVEVGRFYDIASLPSLYVFHKHEGHSQTYFYLVGLVTYSRCD